LSEKYASCAVIRLRRSDFIEATYAFSFVFANFGIAIAARMPMMTTTIRSSMRVKPFWLRGIGGLLEAVMGFSRLLDGSRLPGRHGVVQTPCQSSGNDLNAREGMI